MMFSCINIKKQDDFIVEVDDVKLYNKDLPKELLEKQKKAYIKNWIETQLYVTCFNEKKLPKKLIEQRVDNYKKSLKKHELEQYIIKKRLDTIIKEEEIISYYKKNIKDFELKDFIVKVLYLKIPSNAPELKKLETIFLLKKPEDTILIKDYLNIYAENYYYDDDSWIYFDDILKEIPLEKFNKKQFIINKTKTSFENNGYFYFLNIYDYRLKDSKSPMDFEKKNIRQRIINNRIKELRRKIKKEIIDEAYSKNKIKFNS